MSRFVIIFFILVLVFLFARIYLAYGAPFTAGTGFFLFTSHCHLFPCMTDSDSDSGSLCFGFALARTHARTHASRLFLPLLNCSLHLVHLVPSINAVVFVFLPQLVFFGYRSLQSDISH